MFPQLEKRSRQKAGTLSGGEQQMCAIGRGLMARPRLLLLDEPALGLAPLLVKEVFAVLKRIRGQGVTVLLVEQNVPHALALADRAYVLETGRVTLAGPCADLARDPRVRGAVPGRRLRLSMSHAERLFAALESHPEKPAIVFEGRTWTFADLDRLSAAYARGLTAKGIGPGDRVAVFAETSPEVIVALLGHYRLGAVHVPINSRYRGEELSHILGDSGARAVLLRTGSSCARVLEEIDPPPGLAFRIWSGDEGSAAQAGDAAFDRLVETPARDRRTAGLPSDEDPAILLYTSGTTGKSKGVELSFRAVVANTEAVTRLWRFSPEDRMALALPLFHVHGLGLGVHGALLERDDDAPLRALRRGPRSWRRSSGTARPSSRESRRCTSSSWSSWRRRRRPRRRSRGAGSLLPAAPRSRPTTFSVSKS